MERNELITKYLLPEMAIYKILAIHVPLVFHRRRKWGSDEKKKPRHSTEYQGFRLVGMTGFEPATTRPPDVYSNRAELHPELDAETFVGVISACSERET